MLYTYFYIILVILLYDAFCDKATKFLYKKFEFVKNCNSYFLDDNFLCSSNFLANVVIDSDNS